MTNCGIAGFFVFAILIATATGCASRQPVTASSPPAPSAAKPSENRLSGVWQGTSISTSIEDPSDPGRLSAMQKITLTMFQDGEMVSGFYRCAYGNQVCRHMNETGVIRNGRVRHNRLSMRVMLEDGSMCFFTGVPQGDRFNGGYECLQGGGIIEQGHFETERTY
jgi:hypothetical protein